MLLRAAARQLESVAQDAIDTDPAENGFLPPALALRAREHLAAYR